MEEEGFLVVNAKNIEFKFSELITRKNLKNKISPS